MYKFYFNFDILFKYSIIYNFISFIILMLGTNNSVRYTSIAQQQPFTSNIETTHNAIRQDSTVIPQLE